MTTCPVHRPVQPLAHPGRPVLPRRVAVPTTSVPVVVDLPAGVDLPTALDVAVTGLGATSAQVELLGGTFSRISYCHPALTPDGPVAVGYSQPASEAVVPAHLVTGTATVGWREGRRFVHCHAVWWDAHGTLRGGHLWPETTTGPGPVRAVVHALDAADTTNAADPETLLPVFTPASRRRHGLGGPGARRAVLCRLAPGVDITAAVADTMSEHGFARARLDGSLGSLVGAVLRRADDDLVVPGPATEVVLGGQVDLLSGDIAMTALAVDLEGAVHSGLLVPGANIVAVTAEVLVEEVPA